MPYIFLKTTISTFEGEIFLSKLLFLSPTPLEYLTTLFSIAVMGVFILVHFTLTALFLKELAIWLFKTNGFRELLANPLANTTLFSPLISLPMSMIVFLGPVSFFIPQISTNKQFLIYPAFLIFTLLWVSLIVLKTKISAIFFTNTIDYKKLNFGWLLEVLAFGAVSLLGANIVLSTNNSFISTTAAFMVMTTLVIGFFVFGMKLTILFYQQIKSKTLPSISLLPAYFLIIPPICLLGFSFYKILGYTGKIYYFEAKTISIMVILVSYLTAISWFTFSFYILREYLKKRFLSSDFSPAQWGIV